MPKAVVLAGGVGSRLYPLTKVVPKPMVPFAGAPLLEYIVSELRNAGFTEVIITARYLGEQILNYFSNLPGVKPLLLDSKDTADAVRLVSDYLSSNFLVSMGDVVTNIPVGSFFKAHVERGCIASIVLKEVDNPLHYGLVYVDRDGYITLFSEKPRSLEAYLLTLAHHKIRGECLYSNLVNAGIYAFREEVIDILKKSTGLMDFGKHVFPYLLEEGYRVYGWIAPPWTYWNDIGNPSTYKESLWDVIDGKVRGIIPRGKPVSSKVYVGEEAVVEGQVNPPVYIGRRVKVEPGATIGPYAILEEGVVVKKNARVFNSIVWQRTVVGDGAYIYDSILMNNAFVKPQVKVVSSIIGSGCEISRDTYYEVVEPCRLVSPYAD